MTCDTTALAADADASLTKDLDAADIARTTMRFDPATMKSTWRAEDVHGNTYHGDEAKELHRRHRAYILRKQSTSQVNDTARRVVTCGARSHSRASRGPAPTRTRGSRRTTRKAASSTSEPASSDEPGPGLAGGQIRASLIGGAS